MFLTLPPMRSVRQIVRSNYETFSLFFSVSVLPALSSIIPRSLQCHSSFSTLVAMGLLGRNYEW